MEACAWVLEQSGRLPGRDAWAAGRVEMPVGRDAGDAEIFRAVQNCSGLQDSAGVPLQIKCLRPWAPAGASGLRQHVAI